MNESTKIAQIEQFMKCQIAFNKKVIQHIKRLQEQVRGVAKVSMGTDGLVEILENQKEMIKYMEK